MTASRVTDAMDTGRPSRKEFGKLIDALIIEAHNVGFRRGMSECGIHMADTNEIPTKSQIARKAVMIAAGYGEATDDQT